MDLEILGCDRVLIAGQGETLFAVHADKRLQHARVLRIAAAASTRGVAVEVLFPRRDAGGSSHGTRGKRIASSFDVEHELGIGIGGQRNLRMISLVRAAIRERNGEPITVVDARRLDFPGKRR